jgi:hypothetical protein
MHHTDYEFLKSCFGSKSAYRTLEHFFAFGFNRAGIIVGPGPEILIELSAGLLNFFIDLGCHLRLETEPVARACCRISM